MAKGYVKRINFRICPSEPFGQPFVIRLVCVCRPFAIQSVYYRLPSVLGLHLMPPIISVYKGVTEGRAELGKGFAS